MSYKAIVLEKFPKAFLRRCHCGCGFHSIYTAPYPEGLCLGGWWSATSAWSRAAVTATQMRPVANPGAKHGD